MQAEVISLESRLDYCHKEKQEVEQELADLEQANVTLIDDVRKRIEYIDELKKENQHLTQQSQTAGASVQPDYVAIRNRTLDKLKMSKGSTGGMVIDAFIKELKHGL